MTRNVKMAGALLLAGAVAAVGALPADARARRGDGAARSARSAERPQRTADASTARSAPRRSAAARSRGRPAAAPAARRAPGGEPRVARGRATYGRHRGRSYGYYPYRYYGHYGYRSYGYWGYPLHVYWGFPYWHYGYWGHYPYGRYAYTDAPRAEAPEGVPALVETRVRPKRAAVWVDGVEVGQARDYNGTWDALDLEAGTRELEFRADGYMALRLHLRMRPGGRYVITERLRRGEGLDPRSTEAPPRAPPQPAATAGRAPAEPSPRDAAARGSLRRGLLKIDALPGDAAVYLDGAFLARADELARLHGALPVARGTHTIEVVRPGYVAQRIEVEVEGPGPAQVEVRLQRAER